MRSCSIVKNRSLSAAIVLFLCQISSRTSNHLPSGAVDDIVEAYNSGVKFLINKHAPLQRKTITLRPNAPWYTEKMREGKHNSWKAKRLWRTAKLEIDHRLFKERCLEVEKLLIRSKGTYHLNKIAECGNSKKCLFKVTKNLMGHKGKIILPSCSSE